MKKTIVIVSLAVGGLAFAQAPKADPKAPAKAPEAKKEAPAIKPAEPPKMEPPKPAPEIAAMAKAGGGNWKCTGKMAMDPTNPTAMTDFKGTYKAALDPSKFWIKGDWAVTGTKMKGTMYITYDPISKKWFRHAMSNMGTGGYEWSSGLPAGATEGKMVWEGDHHGMGMVGKTRMTEEVAAKSVKMTSEGSMDGGKTWKTSMEMTCTK